MTETKIEVENINVPGQTARVDRAKYEDMKQAMLKVLPKDTPGLTAKEIKVQAIPHLSPELFPDGKTSGWWAKTVQLDLEAKGVMARAPTKPLTWHLVD